MRYVDPIKEAIQVFMDIKTKIIDKLDKEGEEVGSKLRTRAREIPEMILDLGLVPTLSFCMSKANIDNIKEVINIIERDSSPEKLKNAKPEELAYALYTYAVLKYLTTVANKVGEVELKIEELAENNEKEVSNKLFRYLDALIEDNIKTLLYKLLQPYLLQFKRLCEAIYEAKG